MSRFRNVHCLVWNDDLFPFVPDDCKLVFFHVMTTPMSSSCGLYKASLEALAAEIRWPVKRYEKAMTQVLEEGLPPNAPEWFVESFQEWFGESFEDGFPEYKKGFFRYDPKHQVVWVRRFARYNPPHNPNVLKSWGKSFEEVPNCLLKRLCFLDLKSFLKSFGESFQESFLKSFQEPFLNHSRNDPAYASDTDSVLRERGLGGGGDLSADDLLDLYHSLAPKLIVARGLTRTRREKVHIRLREHPDREFWTDVFAKANATPFLCGKGPQGWTADFDWFMANDRNALKVLEGKYGGREGAAADQGGRTKSGGIAAPPGKYDHLENGR